MLNRLEEERASHFRDAILYGSSDWRRYVEGDWTQREYQDAPTPDEDDYEEKDSEYCGEETYTGDIGESILDVLHIQNNALQCKAVAQFDEERQGTRVHYSFYLNGREHRGTVYCSVLELRSRGSVAAEILAEKLASKITERVMFILLNCNIVSPETEMWHDEAAEVSREAYNSLATERGYHGTQGRPRTTTEESVCETEEQADSGQDEQTRTEVPSAPTGEASGWGDYDLPF